MFIPTYHELLYTYRKGDSIEYDASCGFAICNFYYAESFF